jgi:hypothetical protein
MVTGVFGNFGLLLAFIGFQTSLGRVLGPYGGPNGGGPFTFTGSVYGFFGIEHPDYHCIAGLGAWTIPKDPPPPLPPLTPSSAWLASDVASPYTSWDDGLHPGKATPNCTVRKEHMFNNFKYASHMHIVVIAKTSTSDM